jgi:hypothetical protein
MNLAVKFNLLKNTQPHYSYKPEIKFEFFRMFVFETYLLTSQIQV